MRASGTVLRIHPMRARLHSHPGRIRPWWETIRDAACGLLGLAWIALWGLLLLAIFALGEVSKRVEPRAFLPPTVSSAEDQPAAAEDRIPDVP